MLKELIDDYLQTAYQQNIFDAVDENGDYSIWPTEASIKLPDGVHGTCIRKTWYRLNGFNQIPLDSSIIRKFTLGHLMEDQEIQWAREAGILDSHGVSIKMKNPLAPHQTISGKYDFIINSKDGQKIMIEYKTSSGWFFTDKVLRKGELKIEHILQIGLYLYFFQDKIDHGYISYADRGTWERRDFRIDMHENHIFVNGIDSAITVDMIFERWKTLDEYIQSNKLPPRDFIPIFRDEDEEEALKLVKNGIISKKNYNDWVVGAKTLSDFHCNWCPFKHHCLLNNKDDKNVEINKNTIWNIIAYYISSGI